MDKDSTVGKILWFIIGLVLFIIFAAIYFIVLLFVMDVAAGIVFDDALSADWGVFAAAVLTAATLIGGGSLKFFE